jgi:sugar O-acyltransferase (sialic acid O-acetyltransferase NeuD family)
MVPALHELHVAGTGSFALEVAEYAAAAGRPVAGLIELLDETRVGTRIHGLAVQAVEGAGRGEAVIGAGGDRLAMWAPLAEHGWSAATIRHPGAHVSPSARLAPGCVIAPAAVIAAGAELGAHVLVGRGGLVGHHTKLADGVVLNPGANVAGHVRIGSGARIGMGAVVVDHVTVGEGAIVAAGAVVVRDVPAGARVQGVPARAFEPAIS